MTLKKSSEYLQISLLSITSLVLRYGDGKGHIHAPCMANPGTVLLTLETNVRNVWSLIAFVFFSYWNFLVN
jgi:hypothetical protein